MPSSRSRASAEATRFSRMRSPALSCTTKSYMESHSGVAYSGWLPTSRYRRAPFSRNTLDDRPHETTRRNRYRATSSGLRRRCPRNVHVTPYSFSRPKMRRSIALNLSVAGAGSAALLADRLAGLVVLEGLAGVGVLVLLQGLERLAERLGARAGRGVLEGVRQV